MANAWRAFGRQARRLGDFRLSARLPARGIRQNALILLGVNLSSAAFALAISIVIARALGDSALGAYSLALAWSLTLAQFADFGLNTLITRDLAARPAGTAEYVTASLVARTILGAPLVLGLYLASPYLVTGQSGADAVAAGSGLILLSAWYGTFTAVFRAAGRTWPILLLNVSGLALQLVLTWALVARGLGVPALIVLALAVQLIQLLGAAGIYRAHYAGERPLARPEFRTLWRLLRAGLPFALAGILAGVELRLNLFLLGAIAGEREVGLYSAASRLVDGLRLAPNALFAALLPALAALNANDASGDSGAVFARARRALLLFGLTAALAALLFGRPIVTMLYGELFAPASSVLSILAVGLLPSLWVGLLVLLLYARGDERVVTWILALGVAVQAGAALILIPAWGGVGAAIAMLVSDAALIFVLERRRSSGFSPAAVARTARFLTPVATLFALALVGRLGLVLPTSFDGLYGQDAYAYFHYANELLSAVARGEWPPPFWWPLGYPVLLALASLVGGATAGAAQAATLLSGAAVAPVVYLAGRDLSPGRAGIICGLVAGALCAVSGQLAQSSVVIMADAPAVLWAALATWLLLRYRRTSRLSTLALAGFFAALAVVTRWQHLALLLAWFAALVAVERQAARANRAHRLARVVLASLVVLAALALQLAYQVGGSPVAGEAWLANWRIENAVSSSFDTVDGHFDYALPTFLFYAQVFFHPAYLFPFFTPFLAWGALALARRARADLAPLVLLVGWGLGMFLFLAGIPYQNFRFPLGLFPAIALLAGVGFSEAWRALTRLRWRAALAAALLAGLAVMFAWQPQVFEPVATIKARELAQARWLAQQLPPGAVLYTMGIEGAVSTYTPLAVENLWGISAGEIRARAPAYLFLDVQNVETQWRGRALDMTYRALVDAGALVPVAEFQGSVLSRVAP
jgi:O-antigen/teichoic acid export membrane protein/4-amino-4-deoxy-L-arabinose transferase-like glycosyltransferase